MQGEVDRCISLFSDEDLSDRKMVVLVVVCSMNRESF